MAGSRQHRADHGYVRRAAAVEQLGQQLRAALPVVLRAVLGRASLALFFWDRVLGQASLAKVRAAPARGRPSSWRRRMNSHALNETANSLRRGRIQMRISIRIYALSLAAALVFLAGCSVGDRAEAGHAAGPHALDEEPRADSSRPERTAHGS